MKLLCRVTYIGALVGWEPARNPVEAVQTHDVINAKHACVPHLKVQKLTHVTVPALANALWMQRSKSPILAFGKEHVWGRPRAGGKRKCIALPPNIVTIRVHSERKVEVELEATIRRPDFAP